MDELYRHLVGQQMRVVRERHRIIEGRLRGLGIHPSQHLVLMHLSAAGDMNSQTAMAEHLNVSPASIARTLKNLETGGYIRRNDSAQDGRRNEISITEKGRQVVERSREIFDEIDRQTFAGMDSGELAALEGLESRLLENICSIEPRKNREAETEMKTN